MHSTIFLGVLIALILKWALGFIFNTGNWLQLLLVFYILWYVYKSLRMFYGSTKAITFFKMSFLFFSYMIIFLFCLFFTGIVTFTIG